MDEDPQTFYLREIHDQLAHTNQILMVIRGTLVIIAVFAFFAARGAVLQNGWWEIFTG